MKDWSDPAKFTTNARLFPQDPTACLDLLPTPSSSFPPAPGPRKDQPPAVLDPKTWTPSPLASVPPVSTTPEANVLSMALDTTTDDPKTGWDAKCSLERR